MVDKPSIKPTEKKSIVADAPAKSKNFWIIGGVLAVVVIVIIVAIVITVITNSGKGKASLSELTEEEKYIQFQVEVACEAYEMTSSIDKNDTEAGMEVFGKLILLMQMKAQEYGYSQQDFESLSKKYDEDPAIKEKGKKLISERCPGALENMKEDAPQE